MKSGSQFRIPPPPKLNSIEYAMAFDEVKAVGGDGINTYTVRTQEQLEIGIFHAYDGLPSLCAPPRYYNQVALKILHELKHVYGFKLLHLLVVLHVTMVSKFLQSKNL